MHEPIIEWWRLLVVALVVLAAELFVYQIEHAHAATIGYRIRVEVCSAAYCARIRTPANLWGGKYACEGRANRIRDEAVEILNRQQATGPRASIEVRTRCAPIFGNKAA